MPVETKCCLCVVAHEEFKSLYDESGQGNDVYDITLKYFDPMILSPYHERDSTVICVQCWRHISEFNGFQQSILQTHANLRNLLQNDIKQDVPKIKLEDDILYGQLDIVMVDKSTDDVCKLDNIKDENENLESENDDIRDGNLLQNDIEQDIVSEVKLEDYILCDQLDIKVVDTTTNDVCKLDSLKDANVSLELDNHDVRGEHPICSTSDDEKPLITYVTKAKKKTKVAINVEKKTIDRGRNKSAMIQTVKENVLRVPERGCKANTKLQSKADAETLPHEDNADTQSMDEQNFNASASNNEKEEGATRYTTNSEKKSVKDKQLENDAFIAQWKKELECVCCPTTVSNFTLLSKHYREVHPNQKCYVVCCQRKFYYRFHIVEHIRWHRNPMVFQCDECGKCSTNSRNLAKHKRETHHDGSTVYVCSDCGKIFTSEITLRIHKRIVHSNERKFKCNICEKAFKVASNLREHMTLHTGVDLYQCPFCTKTFKRCSNMHHHRKKYHPKEWAKARVSKPVSKKVDNSLVSYEIIM